MPEKKRPALSDSPWPSEVVWTKASSTEAELSGRSAICAAPRSQGSMPADRPSSDSPGLKLRVPGPISLSGGS
jgi:hypothetical protein